MCIVLHRSDLSNVANFLVTFLMIFSANRVKRFLCINFVAFWRYFDQNVSEFYESRSSNEISRNYFVSSSNFSTKLVTSPRFATSEVSVNSKTIRHYFILLLCLDSLFWAQQVEEFRKEFCERCPFTHEFSYEEAYSPGERPGWGWAQLVAEIADLQ